MSGTSVDGLDLADCNFEFKNGQWNYEILHARSIHYKESWKERLLTIISGSTEDLFVADTEFGEFIGQNVVDFIREFQIKPMLIASHGHTVFHQPDKKLTWQIGNGMIINRITGIPVITDFRRLDVILGGQGAPLVPLGDKLLFPDYDVCLNLGGFSNISCDVNETRIAFDVCPVNIVLNRLSRTLGFNYDDHGKMARQGKFLEELYENLNQLDFYKKTGPKSLGLEWVIGEFLPLLEKFENTKDILNTMVRHIAFQINHAILELFPEEREMTKVLVTGGGVHNDFLMEVINENRRNDVIYEKPANEIIDFKEALIFAFLGLLRYRGEINTLKSVTGASRDSSGGVINNNIDLRDQNAS